MESYDFRIESFTSDVHNFVLGLTFRVMGEERWRKQSEYKELQHGFELKKAKTGKWFKIDEVENVYCPKQNLNQFKFKFCSHSWEHSKIMPRVFGIVWPLSIEPFKQDFPHENCFPPHNDFDFEQEQASRKNSKLIFSESHSECDVALKYNHLRFSMKL